MNFSVEFPKSPKSYSCNFDIRKNANHTFSIQFHRYRKLHVRSMISNFSYMEFVDLVCFQI